MPNVLYESQRGIELIPIQDYQLKSRKIFFNKEVNKETTTELIQKLLYLDSQLDQVDDPEITIYINSPGGDVISGLAVYDVINSLNSPVKTVSIGLCASMGAILFLAGDVREMYPNTRIMIHDPSYGNADMSGQKPEEIKHQLDKLYETRDILAKIIAEKTGKTLKQICKVTVEDAYFNAEEALKFGLATKIIDTKRKDS